MKTKAKQTYSLVVLLRRAFPIFFRSVGILAVFMIGGCVLMSVEITMQFVVSWQLFDRVEAAVRGLGPASAAYLFIGVSALLTVAHEVINGITNFANNVGVDRLKVAYLQLLQGKANRIDPVEFETPSRLDDLEKAKKGIDGMIMLVWVVIAVVTIYLPFFLFMGIFLAYLDPVLTLSLLFLFIPLMTTNIVRTKAFGDLEETSAPLRRRYEYFEKAIGDRAFAKETRTLGAFAFFRRQYSDVMALLNRETWRTEGRVALIELLLKLFLACGYAGTILLLLRSLSLGNISAGALAAVLAAISALVGMMDEVICRHIGDAAKLAVPAQNFMAFMDLPERQGKAIPQGDATIELQDARFCYPNAEKNAVDGVTLAIKRGETIAIVGENGSGKTTLVRLLMGLFLPTEGEVRLRGVSTREIDPQCLYSGISAVLQNFQRYAMTLEENVRIADVSVMDHVSVALAKGDVPMDEATFPQGEQTMLSREFDGVDLSGGQWQRVALARGFYRAHDIIVLDEPTAAIDPIEETLLYKKFTELSRGKTAVIVTHRLGSARIADRIVVMADGKVNDVGTHDALMQRGGLYRDMFEAQAQWYQKDVAG